VSIDYAAEPVTLANTEREAIPDDDYPLIARVPWESHAAYMAENWRPGEHVSIISQNGGGKSFLFMHGLAPLIEDEQMIIFDVKGDDPEINSEETRKITQLPNRLQKRIHGEKDRARWYHYMAVRQDDTRALLDGAYREGHMTLYFDETRALTDKTPGLGLSAQIDALWLRGRSREITVIAGTQAPRFVPSSFYEQARHLYIGTLLDRRAQQRLEEIGGNSDAVKDTVAGLALYEFLYIGKLQEDGTRRMEIVKVPA
jgi:hypothetical protein